MRAVPSGPLRDNVCNFSLAPGVTIAEMLVKVSESPENVAAPVGTVENGSSYLPYTGH